MVRVPIGGTINLPTCTRSASSEPLGHTIAVEHSEKEYFDWLPNTLFYRFINWQGYWLQLWEMAEHYSTLTNWLYAHKLTLCAYELTLRSWTDSMLTNWFSALMNWLFTLATWLRSRTDYAQELTLRSRIESLHPWPNFLRSRTDSLHPQTNSLSGSFITWKVNTIVPQKSLVSSIKLMA
jgi:hypothetical protein